MAERLFDVVTQIQNVRQLGAVVTAMRGIAASRAQRGRSLLAGIEAYTDVISRAIGEALDLLPTDTDIAAAPRSGACKRGLILFCAEQGFAGAFSERVFEAAAGDLAEATTMVVGTRGAVVAGERRIKLDWSAAMPTRVDGFQVSRTSSPMSCMATSPGAPSRRPISSSRVRPQAAASALTGIHSCRSISNASRARLRGGLR